MSKKFTRIIVPECNMQLPSNRSYLEDVQSEASAKGIDVNRRWAKEVADWIESERDIARKGGTMNMRPFVQNVDIILEALREYEKCTCIDMNICRDYQDSFG